MMYGTESRLPFLTRDLVQLSLALPDHLLVSDRGVGKAIFRDAMRGLVPEAVLARRDKMGFAVPLGDWLLGSRYATDLAGAAAVLPCVDRRRVTPWLDTLRRRQPVAQTPVFLLWRLVGLAQWVRAYNVPIE
jgi:asparagine synthase (glutamine-hydrolysing)